MNHQPFEDWLLDDQPLTLQQERELQIHLRSCTTCTGIANSNLALHSRRLIAPPPGFTGRFRPRLVVWRREQLTRQALGTIVLVAAGLALLYTIAGPAMLEAIQSPAAWLKEITEYVVALIAFLSVLGHVGSVLSRALPSVLPLSLRFIILIGGCALGALWIATMRRLAAASQGV
jgi:hypothetical protein